MSYTWVCDDNYNVYMGNYQRTGMGNHNSAHYRLGDTVGVYSGYGGAYYPNDCYTSFRSGTFNYHGSMGRYDIYGSSQAQRIESEIDKGNYYSAYNMGGGLGRVWYNEYSDDIR
eukprot:354897_1